MLKYEINGRDARRESTFVDLEGHMVADDDSDSDKIVVTCNPVDPSLTFTEGESLDILIGFTNYEVDETYQYTFSERRPVYEANNSFSYFSFKADKYFNLDAREMSVYADENGVVYVRFAFNSPHYFRGYDENISFYVSYRGQGRELYEQLFEGCIYVDPYTLDWLYQKDTPGIDDFMCRIFHSDSYVFQGYSGEENVEYTEIAGLPNEVCFTDPIHVKIAARVGCEDRYEYYVKDCGEGDLNGTEFYRESFFYTEEGNFSVYVDRSYMEVSVPLSQAFDVNTEREYLIDEVLVAEQTARSITPSPDMEKFMYSPVVVVKGEEGFVTEPVHSIKFNLHFRQRDSEWVVDPSKSWNGVRNDGSKSPMGSEFFSYHPQGTYVGYDQYARQSDLISYLGFTNSDVRYQKNRLSKSFLRLLYYDSPKVGKQNLVAYSTVFMDSGKLFGRLMKYGNSMPYVLSGDPNMSVSTGIKTNCEPGGRLVANKSNEEIEGLRLSSQFVVSDKYFSTNSSEGFYLYLWADNGMGGLPEDLYMRVEFNHAGYGRTVPFMMPYVKGQKISSFLEVAEADGYTFQEYLEYAHIHLKYRYDRSSNRRVYYLDEETYGDGVLYDRTSPRDDTPNELELNLYEIKLKSPEGITDAS